MKTTTKIELLRAIRELAVPAEAVCGAHHPDEIDDERKQAPSSPLGGEFRISGASNTLPVHLGPMTIRKKKP